MTSFAEIAGDPAALAMSDTGIETHLLFRCQRDLPNFAAYDLLLSEGERGTADRQLLRAYFSSHAAIVGHATVAARGRRRVVGVFETPTWRASAAWGEKNGHSREVIEKVNRDAVSFVRDLRAGWIEQRVVEAQQIFISGCVGPAGDGYSVSDVKSVDEYAALHLPQISQLVASGADLVSAITMTHVEEALGVALAVQRAAVAADRAVPFVCAFTVETDGRLPSGVSLAEAIRAIDAAAAPMLYAAINCAHPTHFAQLFGPNAAPEMARVRMLKVNACAMSHAELDGCDTLQDGDPVALARGVAEVFAVHPQMLAVGGCCGTDERHAAAMMEIVVPHAVDVRGGTEA